MGYFKTAADFGGYWLKGLKNFKGHDGEPLIQGSILKDGKKIGFFSEDSRGGPAALDVMMPEAERELRETAKRLDPEPWDESYHGLFRRIAGEIEFQRRCTKIMKTKTLVVIQGKNGAEGDLMSFNHLWTADSSAKIISLLDKEYGPGGYEILNGQI